MSGPADFKSVPGFDNWPRFVGVIEQNKISDSYENYFISWVPNSVDQYMTFWIIYIEHVMMLLQSIITFYKNLMDFRTFHPFLQLCMYRKDFLPHKGVFRLKAKFVRCRIAFLKIFSLSLFKEIVHKLFFSIEMKL